MNRVALALALLLTACGAPAFAPHARGLEGLRLRAAAAPDDAVLQGQLAIAELFAPRGDLKAAWPQLLRALEGSPRDQRLHLAAGVHAGLHGKQARALDHYLRAIELAAHSQSPLAAHISEVTAGAVAGMQDSVTGYRDRVQSRLSPLLSDQRRLAAPSHHAASKLLIELAYRRGDLSEVQRLAKRAGCITEWRVAGPFGPRVLLGFDGEHAARPGAALDDRYDLGPGRGLRSTRHAEARGCNVNLGGGPVAMGGTSYAQAYWQVPRQGQYVLRVETPNSVELFIDGRSLLRLDRRKQPTAVVTYVPLGLKPGRREITVKLTSRHANPVLSVALTRMGDSDREAIGLPFDTGMPKGLERAFAAYLRTAVALLRGDVMEARQISSPAKASSDASPLSLLQRAAVVMSDPLLPSDQRQDEARRLLKASLQKDDGLWSPALQIARLEANNGRVMEAIASLRKAMKRWPENVSIALALVDLLRERDWHTEADVVVEKMRALVPDACGPLEAELYGARYRGDASRAARIAEALVACDARSSLHYGTLLRQHRWTQATAELQRLAALEPRQNRFGVLLAGLELAKNSGDREAFTRTLQELRRLYPRSNTALLEEVDHRLSEGLKSQAWRVLDDSFDKEPAATLGLRRLGAVISGEHPLSPFRVDGGDVIRQFEASGRSYHQPQVLVFDYMVVRVFEDGSSLELVHNIYKVQSDEAADKLGEFDLPEGARLLTIRTVKPDGRRIEPDDIAGKNSISLPNLLPGDYAEFEYVREVDPPEGFPGGFLGERFYFRSFEIPFDISHLIVVLPRSMQVQVDPRGDAPKTQQKLDGDLRILSWKVEGSRPLAPEPSAVAAREYIPSINVAVGATWDGLVESLRDVLVDRDLFDPSIRDFVTRIVGEASEAQPVLRAKRLYAWVAHNVEDTDNTLSQAAVMLRARTGNRARILRYMLELAGVPAQLALVRSLAGDATPSEVADSDTYGHLLLTIPGEPGRAGGRGRIWLSTGERWFPFGYVPPLLRGQDGLLLAEGAPKVRVRSHRKGEERQVVNMDIELAHDGTAQVETLEQYTGTAAVVWRKQLEGIPVADLERRMDEAHVARVVPGASLTSLQITGREDAELPLELRYRFEVGALGRRVPGGRALPGMLSARLATNYANAASRTTTQVVALEIDRRVNLNIQVPPGTSRPRLPKDVTLRGPNGARFSSKTRWKRGTVVIQRSVRLPAMRIEPATYEQFARFCRDVDAAEAREIVLQMPAQTALSSR